MLTRLGLFIVRRRRAILVGAVLFVVASFAVAGGVASRLTSGGFADPNSESERAAVLLQRQFGAKEPNVVLLVSARHGSVDDAAVRAAGLRVTRELARQPSVGQVASYWSLDDAAPLESKDGRQALVLGVIAGQRRPRQRRGEGRCRRSSRATTRSYGSRSADAPRCSARSATRSRRTSVGPSRSRSRSRSSCWCSCSGASSPRGSRSSWAWSRSSARSLALYVISAITDVSIFSLNLTTALGLGLAIDYSLFVVSRFREELRNGLVDRTTRWCAPSRPPVARSPSARSPSPSRSSRCWLFPLSFLRSFAYAGSGGVACWPRSVRSSCCPRCSPCSDTASNSVRVFRHREPKPVGEGIWHRVAMAGDAAADPDRHRGDPLPPGARRPLPPPADRSPRRPGAARRATRAARCRTRSGPTSRRKRPARCRWSRPGSRIRRPIGRDRRLRRSRSRACRAWPGSTPLTGSYVDGAGGPRAGGARRTRFEGPRGTWLSVVPSVEPMSAAGEQLTHDVRGAAVADRARARRRAARAARRQQARVLRTAALGRTLDRGRHVRVAVPHVRVGRGADQGAGAQRAQPHRDVRRDGVDLPGRPPVRVPRLHADGNPRRHDADPHVLRRLRPVDGLRGVPALPHQGGARPHARQRQVGRARASSAPGASSPPPPC